MQPKWKNPPTIADMDLALADGLTEFTEHEREVQKWLEAMNPAPFATPATKIGAPSSTLVPKLIRKHAEWRYASLSEPFHTAETLFTVKPFSFEDDAIAMQDNKILAHQFGTAIDTVDLVDTVVRTAVDEGTVLLRVGWELETEEEDVQLEVVSNGLPTGKFVTRKVERTVVSRPTVKVVRYDEAIIDPNARGDLNAAEYIIYKYRTSIAKLRQAGGYENLDDLANNVSSGSASAFGEDSSYTNSFEDPERTEFEVYEYWGYWDINKTKGGKAEDLEPIVVTFTQGEIIKMQRNPFPDGKLPFVLIQFLPSRGHNYGEPDGVLLEDSQKISGALYRGTLDLMGKSANGQVGFKANALDESNLLRWQRGEDYMFRQDVNPAELMYQHAYPEIPSSALQLLQMQQTEAESLTGVNTFGQGITGASLGDSATGVRGALDGAGKRESGMLRRIAAGLERVARKVILMNHAFLMPEDVQKITNKEYVQPKIGETTVDVKVDIRTAEADAKDAESLAFITQTVGNTIDPQLTQVLLGKWMELNNMPDVAEQIRSYQPPPDPVAEEMKMLELELLKAKLANEYAKAGTGQAKAQLDQAKVQTELEKARKTGAEADMQNLEFVEEETGTNHERALDVVKAQAEGNMYLESTKASLANIDKTGDK